MIDDRIMTNQPKNAEETARLFLEARVSFLMIKVDGSKSPYEDWTDLQKQRPNEADIDAWFGGGKRRGIGMICGPVSDNLEVVDIEADADRVAYAQVVEAQAPGLLDRVIIVATPTGGRHLVYRCDNIEGNQKLAWSVKPTTVANPAARRAAGGAYVEIKTLIETRGAGGYVVAPGSPPKCHKFAKPYKLMRGDYRHIPTITTGEREVLLEAARAFDQYVEDPEPPPGAGGSKTPRGDGTRPGDDFSDQADAQVVAEILTNYGWEPVRYGRRSGQHWRRPGKDEGWSATLFDSGVLHVFTSNAAPFKPDHSYAPFDVLALLHFNGDFGKAARRLAQLGYGGTK